jgi:hypothetical protein
MSLYHVIIPVESPFARADERGRGRDGEGARGPQRRWRTIRMDRMRLGYWAVKAIDRKHLQEQAHLAAAQRQWEEAVLRGVISKRETGTDT